MQGQVKKEALFNEVKGSLFEYLVASELAKTGKIELDFQRSIDRNYLNVLSQQDRMVRQFYPEMLPFLQEASKRAVKSILDFLGEVPVSLKLVGKFSNSPAHQEIHEADLLLGTNSGDLPLSLKLNKKHAFVNTKSGGIKSFFFQYFPFILPELQEDFNRFVDREFTRMASELHQIHDIEYSGDFQLWIGLGLSELPGELDPPSRSILKNYYARIAKRMHEIFKLMINDQPEAFQSALPTLLGFSSPSIIQVIYFHTFPEDQESVIDIHNWNELSHELKKVQLKEFGEISSVEFQIGNWDLQVRVKPMNKFTTTAMKINCSVKVKRPTSF
jgi:hypothetical protein